MNWHSDHSGNLQLAGILFAALTAAVTASNAAALTAHKEYAGEPREVCVECHTDLNVAPNHTNTWEREHRLAAEKRPNNCASCHQQSECLDCHYGGGIEADLQRSQSGADYVPNTHRSDFRELHPLKSLDDPSACYRCHDNEAFCVPCHQKFQAADLRIYSHRKGWSDLEVQTGGPKHASFNSSQCQTCHPASVLPTHQWSSAHAQEARANLASCESCHPDGDVCLQCHSAKSGLMRTPHPKDWGNIAGNLKQAGGSRTCNRCH